MPDLWSLVIERNLHVTPTWYGYRWKLLRAEGAKYGLDDEFNDYCYSLTENGMFKRAARQLTPSQSKDYVVAERDVLAHADAIILGERQ